MSDNRLIIASAGSGKTTQIVEEALSVSEGNVLITTYTQANEKEIKKKIIQKKKSIPSNITIQTWFSFLIQHGVKPYQGALNEVMFDENVRGLNLVSEHSGKKIDADGAPILVDGQPRFWGERYFKLHYFDSGWKIYSDKLSKFVFKVNNKTDNEVIYRISRIYSHIYIDEVQDLAGHDLELIKLLFKSDSKVLLVGDPRQVTYLTHLEPKHSIYRGGKIKQFLLDKCKSLINNGIDEESLRYSHRNNEMICKYSSQLYTELPESKPCDCCERNNTGHDGVFLVRPNDVERYLNTYNPIQLRWSNAIAINSNYSTMNFGASKGLTLERVLIYPTEDMKRWINDNSKKLKAEPLAKFYVGLTRARFSVGILFDYKDNKEYSGAKKYNDMQMSLF